MNTTTSQFPLALVGRQEAWTETLVERMKVRGPVVARDTETRLNMGGSLERIASEAIDRFRNATAVGDARNEAADLLALTLWMHEYATNVERQRANDHREAGAAIMGFLGALFGAVVGTGERAERKPKKAKTKGLLTSGKAREKKRTRKGTTRIAAKRTRS